MDCTINKSTDQLPSYRAVICAFVFAHAYAKSSFSHDAAQVIVLLGQRRTRTLINLGWGCTGLSASLCCHRFSNDMAYI